MGVKKINTATALLNHITKQPVEIDAFNAKLLCRHWKASERLAFVNKINEEGLEQIDAIKNQAEIVCASIINEDGDLLFKGAELIEQLFETDPDGVAEAFLKICEINQLTFNTEQLEAAEKNL